MSATLTKPKKQITIAVLIALGLILLLAVIKGVQIAIAIYSNHQMPPTAVTSTVIADTVWQSSASAVASLVPVQGARLSAEEAGRIAKIQFQPGATVKAGDVLVEIDSSVEEADLRVAQATAEWSKQRLIRAQTLRAKNANSIADLQQAEADYKVAVAQADSLKSKIARKRVVAPFSGITGIWLVNTGDYVTAGTPIVSLQSFDTLYVDFSLPQNLINKVQVGQPIEVELDENSEVKKVGTISGLNPDIDMDMRSFRIRGTIENSDHRARPGMFARTKILFPEKNSYPTMPLAGVKFAPYGDSVFVVEKMKGPDGAEYTGVREQIVKLGERRGDQVAVLEGIKAGQEVVSSGAFKLRPAIPVVVNNSFATGNDANPKPENS